MPKFMNLQNVLMNEAGGDGADGGGGSGDEPTIEQLQSQLNDITSQFNAVKAKNEELLTETKRAKEVKRQAEEEAARKAEEAAKKAGDFESLHKSAMQKLQEAEERYSGLQSQIASEKVNNAAMKIATELADGSNADLLSTFIAGRLKYADGKLQVTNADGELTVSSMDDLKNEFANDARFGALLKGNQSSGGGATGGKNGSGAAKVKTRAEFEALSHADRSKFFASGGKLSD